MASRNTAGYRRQGRAVELRRSQRPREREHGRGGVRARHAVARRLLQSPAVVDHGSQAAVRILRPVQSSHGARIRNQEAGGRENTAGRAGRHARSEEAQRTPSDVRRQLLPAGEDGLGDTSHRRARRSSRQRGVEAQRLVRHLDVHERLLPPVRRDAVRQGRGRMGRCRDGLDTGETRWKYVWGGWGSEGRGAFW